MNVRHLIIAASVMAFANLASAQTPDAAASVKADPNTPIYSDPIVQKRHADHVAKAEYKAAKKASKRKMNQEKSVAKSEMKAEKKEANAVMKESLASSATTSEGIK